MRATRGARLFIGFTSVLAGGAMLLGNGCVGRPNPSGAGTRIDVLGWPRPTDAGGTTNRNTIHRRPAQPPPASATPAN